MRSKIHPLIAKSPQEEKLSAKKTSKSSSAKRKCIKGILKRKIIKRVTFNIKSLVKAKLKIPREITPFKCMPAVLNKSLKLLEKKSCVCSSITATKTKDSFRITSKSPQEQIKTSCLLQPEEFLGITKVGIRCFIVKWKNSTTYDLMSLDDANKYYPRLANQYYQKFLVEDILN